MNITVTKTDFNPEKSNGLMPPSSQTRPVNGVETNRPDRKTDTSKDTLSIEETKKIADELDDIMENLGTNIGFQIREEMGNQVVVEVKNRQTNELIRQIPSEELLKIMEKMEELTGLIFDQRI
jgi:flagellar protein FlaG